MTTDHAHLGDELLEELADDLIADDARRDAERHLAACPRCAARLRALRVVGSALGALPLERAPEGLTRSVLGQLDEKVPARTLTLAGWFSGILGLMLVGSVLLAVFASTGVISLQGAAGEGSPTGQYWSGAWTVLADLLGPAGKWFNQHLPAASTVTTMVLTLAVLAGLGLLDRVLGRRFRGEHGI